MSTFKLCSIHSDINGNLSVNIAHFFHEALFCALEAYLQDTSILWILDSNLKEWDLQFTLLCIKHLHIHYKYENLENYRTENKYNYNIKVSKYFQPIMDLIQTIIKTEFPTTTFNPNYKVLYFRNDAYRRKVLDYNGTIDHLFDEIIYDFYSMPFHKQVQLFMKCSHLVTIEGATITNIVFMNKEAKVLNISPVNNSWPILFGTDKCVKTYDYFVLGLSHFNENIQYNSVIENKIKQFVSS